MKHVLIADDEPHLIRVLRLGLEKAGYKVSSVTDGERALEKIRVNVPDVLITDIEMPRMDGEQLCRTLEEEVSDPKLLVIVVTSHPEENHRVWSSEIPRVTFLEKPLSVRKLCRLLDAHFAALGSRESNE